MAIPLIVAGQEYLYSENRDNPGWGEGNTAWSVAVTNVLQSLAGTGDILQTPANINNNQIVATSIPGLSFDPTQVRAAIVEYSVYRVTTGVGATELVESGTMYPAYKSVAAVWDMPIVGGQGAGVQFSILPSGQIMYTSSNMSGSNYSGLIKFRARAFTQ
jgi:hypothetical protein